MQHIPRDLLRRLLALPDGQPLRLVVNTNGHGVWQTEVTLFAGACGQHDLVDLSLVLQQEERSCLMDKIP